jgi:hypothetical protein
MVSRGKEYTEKYLHKMERWPAASVTVKGGEENLLFIMAHV